jgi:anti-sigma B factor antagonist
MRERARVTGLPPAFHIELRPDGDRVLVCPVGEMDVATVGKVEARIGEQIDRGARHVVVDLTGVSFMDSTGVRLLLVAEARAKEAGARLSVLPGSAASHRTLQICGLLDHLDVVDA